MAPRRKATEAPGGRATSDARPSSQSGSRATAPYAEPFDGRAKIDLRSAAVLIALAKPLVAASRFLVNSVTRPPFLGMPARTSDLRRW